MKRRIESKYAYPTKYEGDLLVLHPGMNLVDEAAWANAKRQSSRLSGQLVAGKVVDLGRHAKWYLDQVQGNAEPPDVNDLDVDGLEYVVARVKDRSVLELLLNKAERGGLKAVLRTALGGRG